ncbi:hypothetical protein [Haliscomenobacter sp.]
MGTTLALMAQYSGEKGKTMFLGDSCVLQNYPDREARKLMLQYTGAG